MIYCVPSAQASTVWPAILTSVVRSPWIDTANDRVHDNSEFLHRHDVRAPSPVDSDIAQVEWPVVTVGVGRESLVHAMQFAYACARGSPNDFPNRHNSSSRIATHSMRSPVSSCGGLDSPFIAHVRQLGS